MTQIDPYVRDIVALTTAARNRDVTFITETVNAMPVQYVGELFVALLAQYSVAIEAVAARRGVSVEEWLVQYGLETAERCEGAA